MFVTTEHDNVQHMTSRGRMHSLLKHPFYSLRLNYCAFIMNFKSAFYHLTSYLFTIVQESEVIFSYPKTGKHLKRHMTLRIHSIKYFFVVFILHLGLIDVQNAVFITANIVYITFKHKCSNNC